MPSKRIVKHSIQRKGRSLSNYNIFMRNCVLKVKKENPSLSHREAFQKAAKEWNKSPENPKNISAAYNVKETGNHKT
ncbi:hypothetical protein GpartN1_g7123.t1 [Galdieria partita]|uniref:YABBY protein C-terminal domain-containing protein n=1 Tax=Galdieria partita TaxID=83374 RepID=A0A9C7Q4D4_9RHOD|nr:hypothetical protein GpartN1_g6851.t1 [Galdieria partita]GJQ15332.1 hypothetical protein GpartN1_g7123.t1 [Galdieria partita]